MATMNRMLLLGVCVAVLAALPAAGDSVTVLGEILTVGDDSTVDWVTFTTDANDVVSFDMLANGIDFGGGASNLDPEIFLFAGADPSNVANLLLASNDDDGLANDTNGSISGVDSFLGINLAAGTYTLAIGDFNLTEADARAQLHTGDEIKQPGSYQVDIFAESANISNVLLNGQAIVPVPPAVGIGLLGAGIVMVANRKRKQNQN